MFRRSEDVEPTGPAGVDESTLEHFSGLEVARRAAEVLSCIVPAIDEFKRDQHRYPRMNELLSRWLPEPTSKWSAEQWQRYEALQLLLFEAFQTLVLSRLVTREEAGTVSGTATSIRYANSPAGRAAADRGDAAEVIARRLPE
jgi:hypothetical protein